MLINSNLTIKREKKQIAKKNLLIVMNVWKMD